MAAKYVKFTVGEVYYTDSTYVVAKATVYVVYESTNTALSAEEGA